MMFTLDQPFWFPDARGCCFKPKCIWYPFRAPSVIKDGWRWLGDRLRVRDKFQKSKEVISI